MSTSHRNNNTKLKIILKGVSFISPLSSQNHKHSPHSSYQHRHNTSNSDCDYHLRSSRTNIITRTKNKINLHNASFVLHSQRNASHKKVTLIGKEFNLNKLFNDNNSRNNKYKMYYERKSQRAQSNVNLCKERSQSTNNRNKGKKKRIKRIDDDDERKCFYNNTWIKDNNKRTSTKESTTSIQTNGNDDHCKGVGTPEELHSKLFFNIPSILY